jgi:hypothetical protein
MHSPHHKDFAKEIRRLCHRHALWQVFTDFCEVSALSLANALAVGDLQERREARYLEIVARYRPEEVASFPKLLGITALALEEMDCDFLGELFMSLELSSHWHGQFFTPFALCHAMAELQLDQGLRDQLQERGFVTVHEPACGAGGMVIGFARALRDKKINYQHCMHAVCIDTDSTAAHMAYVQLSLLHVPAVVIVGNTLTLEQRDAFYTPAHMLGFWGGKLRRGYALDSVRGRAAAPDFTRLSPGEPVQVADPYAQFLDLVS